MNSIYAAHHNHHQPPHSAHLHPSFRNSSQYDYRNSNYDFYDYYNPAVTQGQGHLQAHNLEHLSHFKSYNSPAYHPRRSAAGKHQYRPYTPQESVENERNGSGNTEYKSQFDYYHSPSDSGVSSINRHSDEDDYDYEDDNKSEKDDALSSKLSFFQSHSKPPSPSPSLSPYKPCTARSTVGGSATTMAPYGTVSDPHMRGSNEDGYHHHQAGPAISNFAYPLQENPSRNLSSVPTTNTSHHPTGPRNLISKVSKDSGRDSCYQASASPTPPPPPPAGLSSLNPSTVSEENPGSSSPISNLHSNNPIQGISTWGRTDPPSGQEQRQLPGSSSPSRLSVSSNSSPTRRPERARPANPFSNTPNLSPERRGRGSGSGTSYGPMAGGYGAYGRSNNHSGYPPYRYSQNLSTPAFGGGASSSSAAAAAAAANGSYIGLPASSNRSSQSFRYDRNYRNSGIIDPRTATLGVDIDLNGLTVDGEDVYLHPAGAASNSTSHLGSGFYASSRHPSESSGSKYGVGPAAGAAASGMALGAAGSVPTAENSSAALTHQNPEAASFGPSGSVAGPGSNGALAGRMASQPLSNVPLVGSGGGGGGGEGGGFKSERSEFMKSHEAAKRKKKRIIIWALGVLVLLALAGGLVGGILGRVKKDNKSGSGVGGGFRDDDKGDLNKDSKEIKALMNNPDLHKVFPGVDYTPLNSQYPDCVLNPPSQNNVTRDMAVLARLTNRIRLYGNDCNQTEMVLHAIDRLDLKPTSNSGMHVWLGVWLDSNSTTNDRQMSKLWTLLDKYGQDPFDGVVVGNEVLFRKDMTTSELSKTLSNVRNGLDKRGFDKLRLATSDLGSAWTKELAKEVDVVMSNIHPFFGGVPAAQAGAWTWTFWQNNDVVLTSGDKTKHHVISEVGWPSAGGNDCGPNTKCQSKTDGSVAGIKEMNKVMDDWVCQSLTNGTDYFWFEAFDEPWKVRFNTKGEEWEDKWGLMDVNRKLKPGVKIPDCGGKSVDGMKWGS